MVLELAVLDTASVVLAGARFAWNVNRLALLSSISFRTLAAIGPVQVEALSADARIGRGAFVHIHRTRRAREPRLTLARKAVVRRCTLSLVQTRSRSAIVDLFACIACIRRARCTQLEFHNTSSEAADGCREEARLFPIRGAVSAVLSVGSVGTRPASRRRKLKSEK